MPTIYCCWEAFAGQRLRNMTSVQWAYTEGPQGYCEHRELGILQPVTCKNNQSKLQNT